MALQLLTYNQILSCEQNLELFESGVHDARQRTSVGTVDNLNGSISDMLEQRNKDLIMHNESTIREIPVGIGIDTPMLPLGNIEHNLRVMTLGKD